jgi:hypothetical protein
LGGAAGSGAFVLTGPTTGSGVCLCEDKFTERSCSIARLSLSLLCLSFSSLAMLVLVRHNLRAKLLLGSVGKVKLPCDNFREDSAEGFA